MCMKGPHRVVAVFPDGMAATRDLNGKEELAYTDSVPDVAIDDFVLVAYGCITQKLDPAVAEQAIAAMAGLVSDEPFVLKSAQGDDAYQPEAAPLSGAPVPDPAAFEGQEVPFQAVLAFG